MTNLDSTPTQSTPATEAPVSTPSTTEADIQAKIDAVAANVRKEASAKAIEKLFNDLGVKSADELKQVIAAKREADEANQTELQKLAKTAKDEADKRAALEAKLAEMEQKAIIGTRNAEVTKALINAKVNATEAEDLIVLLQAKYGDVFNGVLDADGKVSEKGIKTLVEKAQTAYPKYFANTAPGSPSNYDGRVPDLNQKRIKSILGELPIVKL